MNAVHFNLHFDSDQKTRLFAKEIQSILEESLAITNAIPEVDISSLEIHGLFSSSQFILKYLSEL